MMANYDYPHPEQRKTIAGAEWWIQKRGAEHGLHFHYDKDEVLAGRGQLHCPYESTITFLTNGAALVLLISSTAEHAVGFIQLD